jgi:hypothetical protein
MQSEVTRQADPKPCLKVWVKSASVTSMVARSRSTSSASPDSRDIEYNAGDSRGCREVFRIHMFLGLQAPDPDPFSQRYGTGSGSGS